MVGEIFFIKNAQKQEKTFTEFPKIKIKNASRQHLILLKAFVGR